MCIELGSVADWITAVGSVATAVVAWLAYAAWGRQLRGATKHTAAAEIAEAASLLKYYFYDARSPLIMAGEFPDSYHLAPRRTDDDEATGYAHVYAERWRILWPWIERVAQLRAKAAALLSDEVADAVHALAKLAGKMHGYYQESVGLKRDGDELVAGIPNQDWVKEVHDSVAVGPGRTDKLSQDFDGALATLTELLKRYL